MLFPVPQQNLTATRADFRITEFRKFVQQKGLRLDWEQTLPCPCTVKTKDNFKLDLTNISDINANSAGNSPNCPVCGGKGLIRHSVQEIKGIITNASGDEKIEKYGLARDEKIKITLEPEHLPSYGDRFTFKDSVIVWNEIITMPNIGDVIELKSNIVTRSLNLVTGQTDVNILFIQKTGLDGNAILNGDVPLTDFIVDTNTNQIIFTNPLTKPLANTKVSVSYYTNPSYVVVEYPHTFRDTFIHNNNTENFTPMLIQVQCKMEVGKASYV